MSVTGIVVLLSLLHAAAATASSSFRGLQSSSVFTTSAGSRKKPPQPMPSARPSHQPTRHPHLKKNVTVVLKQMESQFELTNVSCSAFPTFVPGLVVTTCYDRDVQVCPPSSPTDLSCATPVWTQFTDLMIPRLAPTVIVSQHLFCFRTSAKKNETVADDLFQSLCLKVGICYNPFPYLCLPGSAGATCDAVYNQKECDSCLLSPKGTAAEIGCGSYNFTVADLKFPDANFSLSIPSPVLSVRAVR